MLAALLLLASVHGLTAEVARTRNRPTCLNGATYNGYYCVCPTPFYGTLCEFANNRIVIGTAIPTAVRVEVTENNTLNIPNTEHASFEDYLRNFATLMSSRYGAIQGFQALTIVSPRVLSSIIEIPHFVNISTQFKTNESLTFQYNAAFQKVEEILKSKVCDSTGSLCFERRRVTAMPHPLEDEFCLQRIGSGFAKFYKAEVLSDGLVCVSNCDLESANYIECNGGSCRVEGVGPRCFCPDHGIYSSSNCRGSMVKEGVFAGLGLALGVVLIAAVAVSVLLYKKYSSEK